MNEQLPDLSRYYYHVDHLIAEGGTAKVYEGVDIRSGFLVAIKELKLRHLSNPVVLEKFRNVETQLYQYMQHPNIPKLIDFLDVKETGKMYIVMEFIPGISLECFVHVKNGLMPDTRALPMFIKVLDTVEFIHNCGYLHLDIKSNNVMVLPDNQNIKLIDLGIASCMSDVISTNSGYGTLAYMPPEQTKQHAVGRYTDIFSLGVLLFEMLTCNLPFTSPKTEEVRRMIEKAPTPPMKKYYPFISDDLQMIVNRAMDKNPARRYQTCAEFKKDIIKYMNNNHIAYENDCKNYNTSQKNYMKKKGMSAGLWALIGVAVVAIIATVVLLWNSTMALDYRITKLKDEIEKDIVSITKYDDMLDKDLVKEDIDLQTEIQRKREKVELELKHNNEELHRLEVKKCEKLKKAEEKNVSSDII